MSDIGFTPTTDEVRSSYPLSDSHREANPGLSWEQIITVEGFDRWLAEHDREVAAKAWERAMSAFERAHNADMLEPWRHVPDNPYRGAPEQEKP